MIEVKIKYVRFQKEEQGEFYLYPFFSVKGHANKGDSYNAIKCCASVTACLLGVAYQHSLDLGKGYFFYELDRLDYWKCYQDFKDEQLSLNTLLFQLYKIYEIYPEQFSKFELIEIETLQITRKERKKSGRIESECE